MPDRLRKSTKTSSFGTSKRESHDATQFYSSRLYDNIPKESTTPIIDNSLQILDDVFNQESHLFLEFLQKLPPSSIHLIIFSIPLYNEPKFGNVSQYLAQMEQIITNMILLLTTGGRLILICRNSVPETVQFSGFYPFHAFFTNFVVNQGHLMRGEIIWNYETLIGTSYNPNVFPVLESQIISIYKHILIFSKERFKREKNCPQNQTSLTDTISREQFLKLTKSIWKPDPEMMVNINAKLHPSAQDSLDIFNRILQLYSFKEDTIIFCAPENEFSCFPILQNIRPRIIKINQKD